MNGNFPTKEFLALAHQKKVISFDVFDTAIFRTVSMPSQIFLELEKQACLFLPNNLMLARNRIEAESEARKAKREVTLDEIYSELKRSLNIPDEALQRIKEMEIGLELQSTYANPEVFALYKKVRKMGRTIVFSSDMYLSKRIIEKILLKAGYRFEKVYVSCDLGLGKQTGLFHRILLDFGISADELLHLGDNQVADHVAPSRSKIASLRYDPPLSASTLIGHLKKAAQMNYSPGRHFTLQCAGFSYGALIYSSFVQWLAAEMRTCNPEKVFFMARDGYILKRVCNIMCGSEIPSRYLYVSRKTLCLSAITEMDEEAGKFLISGIQPRRVRVYLERIGLEPFSLQAQLGKWGLDVDSLIQSVEDKIRLKKFFHSIGPLVIGLALRERNLLRAYLESIGLDRHLKIALVDVGWLGSQQWAFEKIVKLFDWSVHVEGYYYAALSKGNKVSENRHGLVYPWVITSAKQIEGMVSIMELLHSAPHGGVIGYERKGLEAVPILQDNEPERSQYEKVIGVFHKAALDGVRYLMKNRKISLYATPKVAACALEALCIHPTPEEAGIFGELFHFDGFEHAGDGVKIAPLSYEEFDCFEDLYRKTYWKGGLLTRWKSSLNTNHGPIPSS